MSDLTADRLALRYLVEQYAHACDTRDAELLRSCFVDGASLHVHWDEGPRTLVFPEAADRIPQTLSRYDRTRHLVANHRVEIDGDDATGITYCDAHHVSGADDHVMVIRYVDTYRRTPDGWRIVERHLHQDWTEDRTVTP